MENNTSKCAKLYQSLKPDQQKRLLRWLEIEVDVRQVFLLPIFHLVIKGKANDEIRKVIFPMDGNNDRLNKEMNKLTDYVTDFIVCEKVRKKSPIQKQRLLIEELYDKKLGLLNDREISTLLRVIEQAPERDEDFHAQMRLAFEYLQTQKLMFKPKAEEDYSNEILRHQTLYFAMSFLRYATVAQNNPADSLGIFAPHNVERIVAVFMEQPEISAHQLIRFYWDIYQYPLSPTLSGIQTLSAQLTQIKAFISEETATDFFRLLLNFARKMVRTDYSREAYQIEWNLYMLGLTYNWVKLHGETSAVNYLNIVFTGAKLFPTEELWELIQQNTLLTGAISKYNRDVKVLTEMLYLFEKEDYKQLKKIDHSFENYYYKLIGKLFWLKADYMTIEDQPIDVEDYFTNKCKPIYTKLDKERKYKEVSKEFRAMYQLTCYKHDNLQSFYTELITESKKWCFPNKNWYITAVLERLKK